MHSHGSQFEWAQVCALAIALDLCVGSGAQAQEFSLLAGSVDAVESSQHSYAWSFEFREPLTQHLDVTLGYLNEGHPRDHHRDGINTQLWIGDTLAKDRLRVGLGLGAYRFFDTATAPGYESVNVHGWGLMTSLTAAWRLSADLSARVSVNHVAAKESVDFTTYLVGCGWKLKDASLFGTHHTGSSPRRTTPGREILGFAGIAIVNTFRSEQSVAWGVEYRRGIGRTWDWTVSWINEGDPEGDLGPSNRHGIATQVWMVTPLDRERFALGIGIGPYLFRDRKRPTIDPGSSEHGVSLIVTGTLCYRLGERRQYRLNWNRVVSNYHRDSDVIVIGYGVRWPSGSAAGGLNPTPLHR